MLQLVARVAALAVELVRGPEVDRRLEEAWGRSDGDQRETIRKIRSEGYLTEIGRRSYGDRMEIVWKSYGDHVG